MTDIVLEKPSIDVESMKKAYTDILENVGDDPRREGLLETPKRAAKAMQYLTRGYHQNLNKIINGAVFESDMDEMVLVQDIEMYSLCEHHLLPFIGKCHVAYIPNGKVIGLSKIARITDFYARRLQVQEQLTHQIAECLMGIIRPKGVGVIIEAQHLCMMMRGVEKQNSLLKTYKMLGNFRTDNAIRSEFINLVS